ncbi:DUF2971 domain-containing protein [Psychromonas arctica]|uniref:DUF2971 domain-containing protein n=1 Tax=Psychromonas arctica TaxID=168275 RepID=UPI0003F4D7C4|nr:DUF2971 domain-containing protein [Psychromonas arctica]
MTDNKSFYKYKTLDNFEFLLDLILKERLYAASYSELNDPMEGVIKVEGKIPKDQEDHWERLINTFRIVCFTKQSDNPLMWSHYADGGKGCVIEFELLDSQKYHKISYLKKPVIKKNDININKAFEILKYKEKPWKYEAEYRCLIKEKKFMPISIKSIIFGGRADVTKVEMLMHIISFCKPELKVQKSSPINLVEKMGLLQGHIRHYAKRTDKDVDHCDKCYEFEIAREYFGKA